MPTAIIKGENLGKKIGHNWIFEKLDFAVEPGQALLVTGENGAGKSMLLLLLAGVLSPSSGRIVTRDARRPRTSYSPFHMGLDEFLSVEQNILGWAGDRRRAEEQIEMWGLRDLRRRKVEQLSSGQRKRTSLARALACESELFLLDEPMAGLDPKFLGVLRDAVASKLGQNSGMAIATHHTDILASLPNSHLALAPR